jgi:hypothetical protein
MYWFALLKFPAAAKMVVVLFVPFCPFVPVLPVGP